MNKIGSAFYGPILATFWLGMLTKRVNQTGAITGLFSGVGLNILLWQFFEQQVSWMWWNVAGFLVCLGIGFLVSCIISHQKKDVATHLIVMGNQVREYAGEKKYYIILTIGFGMILLVSGLIELWFVNM